MVLFRSIPGEEIERYAHELAEEIARQYPPELEKTDPRSAYDRALMRVLEATCEKAAAYRREHRLRLAQKTHFGNAFRTRLEALGYSSRFIDTATEALVVYLGRRT
jgi:hypothetical protein